MMDLADVSNPRGLLSTTPEPCFGRLLNRSKPSVSFARESLILGKDPATTSVMHDERDVREARQQAGLSVLDIAHRTKISATTIEALERRDYAMLPEGAELDAVVRAYADQVGLDPDRLCARIRLERPAEEAEEYVLVPEDIETFPTEEHVSHETALPAGAQLEWYDQNISAVRAFDTEAASPAALSPVVTSKPVVRKPRPLGRVAIPMLALIAATG
jgi:transcriptional regulator with XRE-family HTH domain